MMTSLGFWFRSRPFWPTPAQPASAADVGLDLVSPASHCSVKCRVFFCCSASLLLARELREFPPQPAWPDARCRLVTKRVHGKKRRVRVCSAKPSLPQAGKVVATIPIGGAAIQGALATDSAVWVLTSDRRLIRVDSASNTVTATVPLPDSEWPEYALASGMGSIWVTVASPDTNGQPKLDSVLRIDAVTARVIARIPVLHSPEGVASTPSGIWTANHRSDSAETNTTGVFTVSHVDPATNSEAARVPVETRHDEDTHAAFCCGPQGMTAAAGSIWTTDPQASGNGVVIRIDPTTNAVQAAITSPRAPACGNLAGNDTSVWFVSNCDDSDVVRIDPATNKVVATISVAATTLDIALGNGSVWVVEEGLPDKTGIDRIDPSTNKVTARTRFSFPTAVTFAAGALWVGNGTNLVRLAPN
jgi:hypothetical protein